MRAAPAAAPSNWSSRWPCPGARAAATEGRPTTAEQQEQQLRHVQQPTRPRAPPLEQGRPTRAGPFIGSSKLVGDGDEPVYRSYTYDEYYKKFWSRNLDQEHCLELFRT